MKKIKSLLMVLVMLAALFFAPISVINKTANAVRTKVSYEEFSAEINSNLANICGFTGRIAGSANEAETALYLQQYLMGITNISAVTNASTNEGVQQFEYMSNLTGTYQKSQNIVFRYTAPAETKKTVILGCSYDVPYYYSDEVQDYVSYGNDALNSSSASVATLMALAKFLPEYGFSYNIEFVFFGAGEESLAGSNFYTDGIADTDAENVLCMINLDKVALGEDLYFYIDEVESDFSKYISSLFDTSKIGTKKVDVVNLNKTSFIDNGLGLTYSHIALDSDNVNFMRRKIATINLFAGDYDDGLVFGRCEYASKGVITYSKFDTIEYIKANYGADVIEKNLYQVFETIERILTDKNFVSTCSVSYNQTSWFYSIFGNQKLVIMLTAIVFFVVLAVAIYIHYKLTVKSYFANVEMEFLSSVVKITEHIDGEGKDNNVPKVVSQVIANDIKKNKTLNPEKPKDNEDDSNKK